jgi:hypothetical protein
MTGYRFAGLLVVFSFLSFALAQAQPDITSSGNDFVASCSLIEKPSEQLTEVDFLKLGTCWGFMQGLEEGIGLSFAVVNKGEGSIADLGICFPSEGTVTTEQSTRVVLKYIREHPEKAHERTATLVVLAMKNAFPCNKPVEKP